MGTIYINACTRQNSRTNRLAKALLTKFGADYSELKLYDMNLEPLTEERLIARKELVRDGKLDVAEFKLAHQFAEADTIVIAAPFWDMSFPSILKVYLENIFVLGIVSRYSENGERIGMCKAQKIYYVATSGGKFEPNYCYDYIKDWAMNALGIRNFQLITAQMLDIQGNDAEEILEKAIENI